MPRNGGAQEQRSRRSAESLPAGGTGAGAATGGRRASARSASGRPIPAGRTASGRRPAATGRAAGNPETATRSANSANSAGAARRTRGSGEGRSGEPLYSGQPPRRTARSSSAQQRTGRSAGKPSRSAAESVSPRRRATASRSRRAPETSKGLPGRFGRDHRGMRKRSKHPVLKSVITILFILVLALLAAGVLYVYSAIKDLDTPDPKTIETNLKVSSTMYDSSNNVIKNIYLGDGQREMVTYDQLPENMKNAIIAIEDKTFREHHGFNFVRIVGALRDSLVNGQGASGTSTITQQLARNIWLTDKQFERSYKRKIQEAYYAVQLENNLTKEEILTDYLNTIPLGYHSLGVGTAAKNYFNKPVEDLDLLECAALASLPQAPSKAMIKTVEKGSVEKDDPNLLLSGTAYDYVYSDAILPRIKMVLDNMLDQGYINQSEHDKALDESLRDRLHPTEKEIVGDADAAFFVDWAINNVAENLLREYGDKYDDLDEAKQSIYANGLQIHTTYNRKIQQMAAEEINDPDNYPGVSNIRKDDDGNILNEKDVIMLFDYSNIINGKGKFRFRDGEAKMNADGSLTIYKGYRLNLYSTTVDSKPDVSIEFKDMYQQDENGKLYIIGGGVINIPQGYKTVDDDGNCVVSADLFKDYPELIEVGENITIPKASYTLKQKVIQPQGSAVILDHRTGRVYAMVGGRGVTGEMNFNRALEPRQPGSSMKPIGTYGPAIEMSAQKEKIEDGEKSFGEYWSPLSIIIDEQFEYKGKVWPKNWYSGYRGPTTLRKSVEQSMNVNAVKVQLNVGADRSVDFLHKLGITTLVEEGRTNDMGPAALALGGMTKGAKPIEMASAYGAFANEGIRVAPIAYTEVLDRNGNVILDGTSEETKAMDAGTAFIMNDILRTTVTNGIAGAASVSGVPVGGKTGTTSDNYDVWFVGNTPKLSAAVWIGNDVNLELSSGGGAVVLWGKIMRRVMEGREVGEYPEMPDNVVKASVSGMTDYFIKGTKPNFISTGSKSVKICSDSGYLATPWCPHTSSKSFSTVNGGNSSGAPKYYCNMHNTKPGKYPIDPDKKLNKNFDPDDPDGSKKKEEDKKKKEEDKKKTEEEATPEPSTEPETPETTTPTPETPADTGTPAAGAASVSAYTAAYTNTYYASYNPYFKPWYDS
ncbi:MAG: transglycosylase domain-containing protein [Clostridiales Family XIII bacterium]|nr:transglycosylase domain-containing protein [Clostridiales Family XIII bacterium]